MVCWLALFAWVLLKNEPTGALVPIDADALISGPANEQWMGIFFEEQPVGYATNSRAATHDGGQLLRGRSVFRVISMGEIRQVMTAGTAQADADGRLLRFDFFMSSEAVRLAVRGEVRETELVMEVMQAGEVQSLTLPIEAPPQLSLSLPTALTRDELAVGKRFQVPYFDPVTLSQEPMDVEVTGVELIPGTAEEAYWLTTRFAGVESRRLITPAGDTLREEGGLGMSMVRMTRAEAEGLLEGTEPADLIAMASVELNRPIRQARKTSFLEVALSGADPERIPHDPPVQQVEGARITIRTPLVEELPRHPRFLKGTIWQEQGRTALPGLAELEADELDPAMGEALQPTLLAPADHEEIRRQALEIVGQLPDRKSAAQAINDWVFQAVEKRPVLSVPNGLDVLRQRQGDCNEHTALYVSLARAAGLPARIAAGLVYSDRITTEPSFYYHAWPEVHIGGEYGWVPLDPTFGQFPADATHIKLVQGDLDRQVEIIGLMGKLTLEVIESR